MESPLVNWTRIVFGWGAALYILFGALPYPIPWWGRFVIAFALISIAHSTVSGIVMNNIAKSGPAIVGIVRGHGVGDRRQMTSREAEGDTESTLPPDSTMMPRESVDPTQFKKRRKSDGGKRKKQ